MIKKNNIFIVAEAGNNHEGNFNTAIKLIDKASESGADAIKFQTYDVDNFIDPKFKKSYEKFKKFSLRYEQFHKLSQYCKKKNIIFFSTPFDLKSAIFLNKIQKIFKISSGDNNFTDLISLVASFNKELIISSGLLNLKDLKNIYKLVKKIRPKNLRLSFLHCVSSYPAPLDQINLLSINSIKENFSDVNVGFSDHTPGFEASIAAVALGAEFIEKHFTLNKKMKGPDHAISLDIHELGIFVKKIRITEELLGKNIKVITKGEKILKKYARKSIVTLKTIKKGDIFTKFNLTTKRPGDGLNPIYWNKILGLKAKKNYKKDEKI